MGKTLYGVDIDKPVTPVQVRDALVVCFNEAHCADAGLDISAQKDEALNRTYCEEIVRKMFVDTGNDFDKPTKKAIEMVIEKLADYSSHFRDKSIIEKHKTQIMQLVKKL